MLMRRLLLLGLPIFVLFAFSSVTHARLLHETGHMAIYSADTEPGNQNSHPAALKTDQIAAALSRVRARSGETGEIIDLFPKKNREELAKQLARELGRIDPDQELHLVSFRRLGSFFSGKRNASGARVFMENGRLNLIFGQIDRFFSEFRDPDRQIPPMGSRNQAAELKGSLLPAEGVTLVDGRSDWVALDLEPVTPPQPAAAPVVSNSPPPERPGDDTVSTPDRRDSWTWEELEEGLRKLQRLHSEGLITDQEYDAKKKEMLDAVGPGK